MLRFGFTLCYHIFIQALFLTYYRKVVPGDMLPDQLVKQCGVPGNNGFFNLVFSGAIRSFCGSGANKTHQTFMNMMFVAYDDVADSYYMGISGTNGMRSDGWQAWNGVCPFYRPGSVFGIILLLRYVHYFAALADPLTSWRA
jgi:hypothetical protein